MTVYLDYMTLSVKKTLFPLSRALWALSSLTTKTKALYSYYSWDFIIMLTMLLRAMQVPPPISDILPCCGGGG